MVTQGAPEPVLRVGGRGTDGAPLLANSEADVATENGVSSAAAAAASSSFSSALVLRAWEGAGDRWLGREDCTKQLCTLYAHLGNEAAAKREKAWKGSPTFHIFLHLCQWQVPDLRLNPRSYWTYADEDLVGTLVDCAEKCHPSTMAWTALTKWVLLAFDDE